MGADPCAFIREDGAGIVEMMARGGLGSVNFVEYLSRLRPGLCSWENLHGLKPVHTATERGDPKLVKYLLDMEKDWAVDNHRGREGQTLLHVAASQGRTAVLELLLERGANLSARCHRGATALHYAALAGDKFLPRGEPDCIDALLRHGLDVRVTDNEGNTALHWALKKGCDQAKALLLHGADMEATNNKGESVLHIAKTLEEREVSLFRQDMELEGFRFHWPYSHLMAVRGKPLEEIGQYWGQGLEEGTLPNAHRD
jgi:ankyrin repeat protein